MKRVYITRSWEIFIICIVSFKEAFLRQKLYVVDLKKTKRQKSTYFVATLNKILVKSKPTFCFLVRSRVLIFDLACRKECCLNRKPTVLHMWEVMVIRKRVVGIFLIAWRPLITISGVDLIINY